MRLPSPSMAVAVVALFVALGGSAVAATKLVKNSVGPAQLKKDAVTGAKIKNRSITGIDIKDGSLTGADVDEARLAAVPSARHADKAATADVATTAGSAQSAATAATAGKAGDADKLGGRAPADYVSADELHLVQKRFTEAGSATVLTRGSLTVTARCYDNETVDGSPNRDGIELTIATSKDGAMFSSNNDSAIGGATPASFLNTDTPEADRRLFLGAQADSSDARLFTPIDNFIAVDPDGTGFGTGGMESFGLALNVAGAKCSVAFPVTKFTL